MYAAKRERRPRLVSKPVGRKPAARKKEAARGALEPERGRRSMAVTSGSFPSLLLDEQAGNGEREKREKERRAGGEGRKREGERKREQSETGRAIRSEGESASGGC